MQPNKPGFPRILTVLAVLIFAALACNLPFGGTPSTPVVSTPNLPTDELYTEPPELFPTATQPVPIAPTHTPTAVTEAPGDRVIYNGVSFHNQMDLFAGVVPAIAPADAGLTDLPGWTGPAPAYFQFDLQGYPLAQPWIKPQILVYPIHDFAGVNPPAGMIAGILDSELRVVEMQITAQPFLPMWNAGQVFYARPEIKPFENGKGIRYLSCYAQGFVRIDQTCLFYTYQGLSADGNYYVSAILPVDLAGLHSTDADAQWAAAQTDGSHYTQYINEMRQIIGAAQASDFTPNLDTLDQLVTSLNVAPSVTLDVPARPAFSCSGALATRLVPASRARVTFTDGTPLRVRDVPGKSGKVLKTIPEGTEMFITDGPSCADQGIWWHMQTTNASLSGWVMEGDQGVYFIEPWK